MLSIESKITKSISYQFISLIVNGLAGVFFIPFIISSLGKEQYGIFEIAYSLNIINIVLDIGIGSTITNYTQKYFELSKKKFSEFFWTFFSFKLVLSTIGFILCVLVALNVQFIFGRVSAENVIVLKQVILWFGLGVVIQNLNSFINGVINGFVRFDITSFSSICSRVIYVIVFFIWYFIADLSIVGFSILTFVLIPTVNLLAQLVQVIIYVPEILTYPTKPKLIFIKDTLGYLGGLSLVTVLAQIFNHGTQTLLAIFVSPTLVGEFGILQRIIRLVNQISDMLVRPILPAAHELRKKYSVDKIISKGTEIHSIVVTSIIFIVLVNAQVISQHYLNSEYQNFSLHLCLLGTRLLLPSFAIMLMLYYNEGNSKMSVQFNLFNTILSITFALFGLKHFGFIGFISGLTIGYLLCSIPQLIRYLDYYNFPFYNFIKIYLKRYTSIVFGLIIYFIISYFIGQSIAGIVLWNVLIVISMGAMSWIGLSKGTKKVLISKIKVI